METEAERRACPMGLPAGAAAMPDDRPCWMDGVRRAAAVTAHRGHVTSHVTQLASHATVRAPVGCSRAPAGMRRSPERERARARKGGREGEGGDGGEEGKREGGRWKGGRV